MKQLLIPRDIARFCALAFLVSARVLASDAAGQGLTDLRLDSPLDYQVFQRHSPAEGRVRVSGRVPPGSERLEVNVDGEWHPVAFTAADGSFSTNLLVRAGGWHTCRVRLTRAAPGNDSATTEAEVSHVGVGEVFVVAGQSNAANHGEERQATTTGLVAAFDGSRWRPANDPQPGASGAGGSFLPPFGDALATQFRVPIGVVPCGIGATSVREWLPAGTRFPHPPTLTGRVRQLPGGDWESTGEAFTGFTTRMQALGPRGFRAVLWHQGESDANQPDPARTLPGLHYQQHLEQLIRDSRRAIGWEAPWFVAQVSYHVPGDQASPDIRAAQASLWESGLACEGPDSDALKGELREAQGQGVHFSGPGLRVHAARWVDKVAPWLVTQMTGNPGALEMEPVPLPPSLAPGYPSRDPQLDVLPGFKNPPPGYGEVPFWWWTGDPLDRDRLAWQIERLHQKGIAGMQVNYAHEDTPGWPTYAAEPELFSPAWWDLWKFVAGQCRERGMGIGLSGYTLDWPNGKSLVSRTLYSDPEIQGRELAIAQQQRVAAGQTFTTHPPADTVAIRAYPLGGSNFGPGHLDLLREARDGQVTWTPGAGDWEVWVFTAARKPGTLNPMHPLAGRRVVERFFQPFQDHAPGQSADGLNYFFHDELQFGVGDRIWADDLPERFHQAKGYDLFEALPALFHETGPRTAKYRLDFLDTKVRLAEERYFMPIFQWHHSRRKIYGCDQGSRGRNPIEFGDYFRSVRWYTAPGHDTPGGRADLIKGKVSSSIAHLYNRPRVWLEGYHSLGWGATPENLMFATRENYLYGCNLLNLHGLYYTTHGSFWEWAPPCYHFRMPYWEHMETFLKYFERLSYLMSQGVHQCDVAILYPVAPGQAGLGGPQAADAAFAAGNTLMNRGYDFIFIDFESLARADIRNGRLHVADAAYRVLVLPAMRALRWSTLNQARRFYRSGGIVIAGGALPETSDRAGHNDPLLDAAVRELFGATAANAAAGERPPAQRNKAGGLGIALLPDTGPPLRHYNGGFAGRWAWAKEPVARVHFKGVWQAPTNGPLTCQIRFFCDNEGALYVNGTQLCAGIEYSRGWTGELALNHGDVLTIDAQDHDAPGNHGTAGLFLAVVHQGKTLLATEDLRYTLAQPKPDWRTNATLAALAAPDPANVHPLHRGTGIENAWATLVDRIEEQVPPTVQSSAQIKATHRKIGPRDVFLVMGAPKNSTAEFRAHGRAELWDPWTGDTRPLRLLEQTPAGTRLQLPLEDYEAQLVVFTPNQPHANPPPNLDRAPQKMTLDGDWEFALQPTMDNRFGDFRLPPTDSMIGPEARIFRHAVQTGPAADWHQPDFDDTPWEEVTCDFGPQFWLLGPMPADLPADLLDAQLKELTRIDPSSPVTVAGKSFAWRPYAFSWRQGREGDPGHQGWHGLKKNVTDHFLCLGRPATAHNETKYEPEPAGSRYYLWTSATLDQPDRARIVASTPNDGAPPHASALLTPAAVFVNAARITNLDQSIPLRAGPNPVLVRYDHAGRGYFVLWRENASDSPRHRTPLAMRWFDDPALIRFDLHAGTRPAEWFRFTAPPGFTAMTLAARGKVTAWADGKPLRSGGPGRFESDLPIARAAVVALRILPQTGFSGAAALSEPILLECDSGLAAPGDWSRMGALQCYSGGAWYRRNVELPPEAARAEVVLDLGRVVATAEVRINGVTAGIRVAPPWRVDISQQIKPGLNRIEILVFNTLANHYRTIPTRYRGDLTSGLLGPVTLEVSPLAHR